MSLGLVPDVYFSQPLQALTTPRRDAGLGLVMVDSNPLGCVGCGVPGTTAGPVAEVFHERFVLGAPLGKVSRGLLAVAAIAGLVAGGAVGYRALRRRRRR